MIQMACYGRLGSDPREIQTKSGKDMAVSSLAVNLFDKDGEEHTQWFSIVCFGRLANELLRHEKGTLVSIAGRLQFNEYQTKDGENREELQIIADSLLSAKTVRPRGRKKGASGPGAGPQAQADFDDDISF